MQKTAFTRRSLGEGVVKDTRDIASSAGVFTRRNLLGYHQTFRPPTKMLRIMRMTSVLLLACCIHVSANTSSQTVTISGKSLTLKKVFAAVEKQTGYFVFSKKGMLNNSKPVTIEATNMPLREFIQLVMKDQPLHFFIEDNTIVITRKSSLPVTGPVNGTAATIPVPEQAGSFLPITGRVTDSTGTPLHGATVTIRGRSKHVMTDAAGRFMIEANAGDELTISFVGYESKKIKVDKETTLQIVLRASLDEMSNVVVVSTGYQKLPLERATGAFTHISSAQLEKSNSFSLKDRIEGLVPGMYFETQFDEDQSPNSERSRSIVIRGVGTFGNNNPLIVVDGAPFYSNVVDPWTLINPGDVESITVLKDAAAASIWGSQAANGVIVITTKSGGIKKGQPILNVTADYLVQPVPRLSDIPWASSKDAVDAYRWMILDKNWFDQLMDPLVASKYELPEVMQVLVNMKKGTLSTEAGNKRLAELAQADVRAEFRNLFFRKVESNKKINLSFQGGSEQNKVRTSLTGLMNNSYSKGNSDFQIIGNIVDEYTPKKWLKFSFGSNVFLSSQTQNGVVVNDLSFIPQMSQIIGDDGSYLPMIMNSTNDTYYDVPTWRRRDTAAKYKLPYDWDWNLKREADNSDKTTRTANIRLFSNIQVTLFPGMVVDFYYQYQKDHVLRREYYNENTWYVRNLVNNNARPDGTYPVPPGGMLYESQSNGASHNGRLQLSYSRSFKEHAIRVLGGMEVRRNYFDRVHYGYYGYDPQSLTNLTNLDFLNAITPKMTGDPAGFGNTTIPFAPTQQFGLQLNGADDRFVSTYANAGYTFRNRYDLTASVRLDRTNLYGQSATYTDLPQWSAGLGWQISDETFFRLKFINRLKFRFSYGFNGNIDKSASPYITGYPWIDPVTRLPYAAVQSAPNPGLTWERTGTYNIGMDFAVLNHRVSGGVDLYAKRAHDVLAQIAVNGTYGFQNNRATLNTGNINNTGLEIYINATVIKEGPVKWNTRFNYGTNRNRAFNITQVNKSMSAYTSLAFYYHLPNQPVDYVAAARWAGYDANGIDKFLYQGKEYAATDIPNFNTLNMDDLFKVVGQRNPRHYGQWMNNFSYKGIDLNISLLYKFGHVFVSDYPAAGMANTYFNPSRLFTFLPELMVDRWKSAADASTARMYSLENKITNTNHQTLLDYISRYNTRNVLNAGSVRLQSIALAYRVPAKLTGVFRDVRVQFEARNLGTLYVVNKEGIDPDFPPYSSSVYGALQYVVRNRPQYSMSLRFGL